MPQAALAAVVVVYSLELIKPAEFAEIRRVRTHRVPLGADRVRRRRAARHAQGHPRRGRSCRCSRSRSRPTTRRSTCSAASAARTVFRPRRREHPDDETWPGLLMLRIEGRLFFANAQRVADLMLAAGRAGEADGRAARLAAPCSTSSTPRSRCWPRRRRSCARDGCELWLAGLNPAVFAVVERSTLGETLGRERMFLNVQAAVERFQQREHRDEASTTRREEGATGQGEGEGTRSAPGRSAAGAGHGEAEAQGLRQGAREAARRARQAAGVGRAQGAQGLHRLRGPRRRRQGRHDQGDHRAREPARLPRRRAAGADRAREEPDVRAALPAAPAGGRRDRDLRPQLVQPRRRRARDGLLHRGAGARSS